MGQRLVVKISNGEEAIAAVYYHCSAYSESALEETRDLLNVIEDESEIADLKLRLIRFIEFNGGCIDGGKDSKEWKQIAKMYPNKRFKKDGSRNQGLIAISEDGISEIEFWAERKICIDLEDRSVTNYVINVYDSIEDYNRERKEWNDDYEEKSIDEIPDAQMDLCEFGFDEIDDAIMALQNHNNYVVRDGDIIYSLIA